MPYVCNALTPLLCRLHAKAHAAQQAANAARQQQSLLEQELNALAMPLVACDGPASHVSVHMTCAAPCIGLAEAP